LIIRGFEIGGGNSGEFFGNNYSPFGTLRLRRRLFAKPLARFFCFLIIRGFEIAGGNSGEFFGNNYSPFGTLRLRRRLFAKPLARFFIIKWSIGE
jgi:hypothetical protein